MLLDVPLTRTTVPSWQATAFKDKECVILKCSGAWELLVSCAYVNIHDHQEVIPAQDCMCNDSSQEYWHTSVCSCHSELYTHWYLHVEGRGERGRLECGGNRKHSRPMCFTNTVEAIRVKDISCLTAALEPWDKLSTDLLASSIVSGTLLDVWEWHKMKFQIGNSAFLQFVHFSVQIDLCIDASTW